MRKGKTLKFVFILLCVVMFTNCGVNLYKGFVDEVGISDKPDENLNNGKDALDNGDYDNAINLLKNVKDDPNASEEEKDDALYNLAVATMAKNEVTLLDLIPTDGLNELTSGGGDDKEDTASEDAAKTMMKEILNKDIIGNLLTTYNDTEDGVLTYLDESTGIKKSDTAVEVNLDSGLSELEVPMTLGDAEKTISYDSEGNTLVNGERITSDNVAALTGKTNVKPEAVLSAGMSHMINTFAKISDLDGDGTLSDTEGSFLDAFTDAFTSEDNSSSDTNGSDTDSKSGTDDQIEKAAQNVFGGDTEAADTAIKQSTGAAATEMAVAKVNFEITVASLDKDGDGLSDDPSQQSTLDRAKSMNDMLSGILGTSTDNGKK